MRLRQDRNHTNDLRVAAAKALSPYQVRILEERDWPAWDAFVRQSPQGTLFHTTKWLGATGKPFHIYGCYHQETLVGGMAVEIVGRQTAGHSYFTTLTDEAQATRGSRDVVGHAYNCPYLGVVLPPPSKKYLTTLTLHRNILKSLAICVKNQFTSIRSHFGPDVTDMQPFISAGYTISLRYTYRIDLSDLAIVWSDMTDKRRNDIRKAERDGMHVDDRGSLQDVLSLLKGTFQRHRRAARFSDLADRRDQMLRHNDQCRSFVARDRSGEAVAGIYIVWDEKCAYYLLGGYGATPAHRGAGALALWEAIRYAGSTVGLQRFDVLSAHMGAFERFHRDFGGRLTVAFIVDYERPSFSRDVRRLMRRLKSLMTG